MDFPTSTTAFRGLCDLANEQLGGRVLWSSDSFFAEAQAMLAPGEPLWKEGVYTDRGKWMDGWEPRRRRAPGHDTAIVKLGLSGSLSGVDIDTRYFLGNHAPYASIDVCRSPSGATAEWLRDEAPWTTVLEQVLLERGGHNLFALAPFEGATHARLHIYPAGGVARLRLYGTPKGNDHDGRVDLLSMPHGGRALACSDMFFARMDNLVMPFPAPTMGDGWETKRNPVRKQDWVILALGQPGIIEEIDLDTRHFKGNFPEAARVEALHWPGAAPHALSRSGRWSEIVPATRLGPDRSHLLTPSAVGPFTHLKVWILSDGGISRVRAWGRPAVGATGNEHPILRFLNTGDEVAVRAALAACNGATRWVEGMLAARPFQSWTHLEGEADRIWWHLGDGSWLEAFTHHPRIGADRGALRARFAATAAWAEGEQGGVDRCDDALIEALAASNTDYEKRYGHIFIVCATGLSGREMLARLQARMDDEPAYELRVAAGEQLKITFLRLGKIEVPA